MIFSKLHAALKGIEGRIDLTINGGSDCKLRLLAVGGGGEGNYCGGGSGLIQFNTTKLSEAHSPYTFSVLLNFKNSSVHIYCTHGFAPVVIAALIGQDANPSRGGDGYSGGKNAIKSFQTIILDLITFLIIGGASCIGKECVKIHHPYPDGGENGTDGMAVRPPVGVHSSVPGHGSGQNLSNFQMKFFHLAPGGGGKTDNETSSSNGGNETSKLYGGGGGGVLINGEGPHICSTIYDGQGWGGGQGGSRRGCRGPGGVVLLEVITAPSTT